MAPIISPGRAGRFEASDGVPRNQRCLFPLSLLPSSPALASRPRHLEQRGASPRRQDCSSSAGAFQDRHGEDARDGSRAEGTTEHANTLCLATHMAERELALERAKPPAGPPQGESSA